MYNLRRKCVIKTNAHVITEGYSKIILKRASLPELQEHNDFSTFLTVHDYDLMERSHVCNQAVFA